MKPPLQHKASEDHPIFVVYARRWWMLLLFSALGLLNNVVCYSFAPVYQLAHDHFGAGMESEQCCLPGKGCFADRCWGGGVVTGLALLRR